MRVLPIIVLALAAAAPVAPGLVGGRLLAGDDLLGFSYPHLTLVGERLVKGEVPGWNPWSFGGCSLWGPRAGGVVYPPNALFGLLEPARAMALFVWLHLLLAAEGTRRAARAARLPGSAAVAAGLAFGLGGFAVAMTRNLPFLVSASWLPWALLGGLRLAEGRTRAGLVAGVLGVAMPLLACEPQGALLSAAVLAAPALWVPRGQRAERGRVLAWACGAVLLASALAAPVILSIGAEVGETDRALGLAPTRWGFHPGALLLELLLPDAVGVSRLGEQGYWGWALWGGWAPWCGLSVGSLGLVALVVALRPSEEWRVARRWGIGLVALGVLLCWLDPGRFVGLRYSAKFLVLAALGLSLLVGAGFARLSRDPDPPRWLVTPALLLLGAGLVLARDCPGVEAWLHELDPRIRGEPAREALAFALLRAGAALLLARGAWAAAQLASEPWRARPALLLAVLALDLISAAAPTLRWSGLDRVEGPGAALRAPAWLGRVQRRVPGPTPARVWWTSGVKQMKLRPEPGLSAADVTDRFRRETLAGARGLHHGVRGVESFESVAPLAWRRLTDSPAFVGLGLAARSALVDGAFLVVASGERGQVPHAPTVAPLGADAELIAVGACPPWAFLAASGQPVRTLDQALAATCEPARDPRQRVVVGPELPEGATAAALDGPDPPGEVRAVRFEPEAIELEVRATRSCWLVVRESFSREWTARVGDRAVEVARADALWRAIPVSAGPSRVELRWEPAWWWPAWALSGLALVALAGVFLRLSSRPAAR